MIQTRPFKRRYNSHISTNTKDVIKSKKQISNELRFKVASKFWLIVSHFVSKVSLHLLNHFLHKCHLIIIINNLRKFVSFKSDEFQINGKCIA